MTTTKTTIAPAAVPIDPTRPDPTRLDMAAFARHDGLWDGQVPLAGFLRLLADVHPEAPPSPDAQVQVHATGRSEARATGERHWLQLQAAASMAMVCQRCLAPVAVPLAVDRRFVFAPDEAAAAALDAEIADDVLVETHPFDLLALVEDELLLAEPLVPMHDICPEPLPAATPDATVTAADGAEAEHPFAALAQLRKQR